MLLFAASELPKTVQISTIQALLGIGALLLSIGVAWGTLKTSVKNIGDNGVTRSDLQQRSFLRNQLFTDKACSAAHVIAKRSNGSP